jgi:hypothetical protein
MAAKLKLYDAFETKKQAQGFAKDLRCYEVQYVRVKPITPQGGSGGRLKWGVFIGGKNSGKF